MSDQNNMGYGGYVDDTVNNSNLSFGGIFNNTYMTKFGYIDTGGKGGAQQEALDIVFNINGTDKSYRMFPITKAYLKGGGETTDRNSPEFQEEMKNFKQRVVHILKCFIPETDIQVALNRPMGGFKEYCQVAAGLLPANFDKIALDIFMEWEYSIKKDNKQTYLQIPTKMRNGAFIHKAVPAVGKWHKHDDDGLSYRDDANNLHPFQRNSYYMTHNNAIQQKEADENTEASAPVQNPGNESSAAAAW